MFYVIIGIIINIVYISGHFMNFMFLEDLYIFATLHSPHISITLPLIMLSIPQLYPQHQINTLLSKPLINSLKFPNNSITIFLLNSEHTKHKRGYRNNNHNVKCDINDNEWFIILVLF